MLGDFQLSGRSEASKCCVLGVVTVAGCPGLDRCRVNRLRQAGNMGRNGRWHEGRGVGGEGGEGHRRLVRNGQAQVASCLRVKVSEVLSQDLYCAGTGRIEPAPLPSALCQLGVCYGPRVPDVPGMPTIQHSSLLT